MTPDLKIQEAYERLVINQIKEISEAVVLNHKDIADKALKKAEESKQKGNMGDYHKHMMSHHAAMTRAYEEEGKYKSAGDSYGKMKEHQKEIE